MRLSVLAAVAVAVALAACGGGASPARIQATPAVHETALPTATRAPSNYEGY